MDLKTEIESIKIIDQHQHAMDQFFWKDVLGVAPPFPPDVHGLEIPSPATHLSRAKRLVAMYRKLYNFPYSTITEENKKELQAMYDESKADEAAIYHKVMDLAGIELAFEVCTSRPILPPGLDPKRFKCIALVDGFLIPFDNSELKKFSKKADIFINQAEAFAENMKKELNWHPSSFDDYVKFVSAVIEHLHMQGCVALKVFSGYWRTVHSEWVSEADARSLFEAKDTKPERYKLLQDYLLKHILMKCGEIGLPFHMHTGACGADGFMMENNPSLFDKLLWHPDVAAAKVILLHGGYPYCREAGFMVADFGRRPRPVYLDTSVLWAYLPTPGASSLLAILREWLEIGIEHKLVYGSDATSPFKLWMSAMTVREDLYTALKGMIDEGLISESQALSTANDILRGNAERVYNL